MAPCPPNPPLAVSIGRCPWCGQPLIETDEGVACADEDCGWAACELNEGPNGGNPEKWR